MNALPKSIYKYISLPDDSAEQIIHSLLIENKLKYSDPFTFNDPYDCEASINLLDAKLKEIIDFQLAMIKKPTINNHIKSYTKQNIETLKLEISKYFNDIFITVKNRVRICCFSSTNIDIPMWSYYADNNKGLVVKFNTDKIAHITNKEPVLSKVTYKKISHE